MEEKIERHWYAFYVRMHHEKKTAEKLEMLHVEHFLPIQEVVRQWSDRKKKIKQVVIPMLIFICTDEKGRIELLQNFPSLTGCLIDPATRRPAIIRDKEMEQFKFMLDYSEETVRFQNEPLAPGSCMLEKQLPAVLCYWKNTSSRRVVFSSSISVRRSLQGSKSPGISKVSS